ncbi:MULTISPECIES: hypothetical protein [Nocardioides]|uniref:Uncharacterized protein n=1 Tax=Nocardioides vastitatis TaxID=2568655 RepID=A0ABW0ZBX1_9ACTN|nr:hypothetical protein [Nocardioides sp.]THI95506.1 hypothetical protein E7Z54_18790 [Nocardioides sp.]
MIDELTLLREARPDVAAPDQLTVTRARRRLLRRALSGRRHRRPLRLVAMVVATAAAIVIVGLAVPGGGGSAVATPLTAAHLAVHPEVGPDEFLHIRRVERTWGYGKPGAVDHEGPRLEYWIPGDGTSDWVERSVFGGRTYTHAFDDWGPKLYVQHAADVTGLLEDLRDYAQENQQRRDLHGLWTVAFWIVNDPTAPESFKTEVLNALVTLDGVKVADPDFTSPGLAGKAITIDGEHEVWFVVDPATGAFRGLVGHPEKDETWVGPEQPMWTSTFETDVVTRAP